MFRLSIINLFLLFTLFSFNSHSAENFITEIERKRAINILKKLIDNRDKEVLDLLDYYRKNKQSISKFTEGRRPPEGNMQNVESNTSFMDLQLNLDAENIDLSPKEWLYVDKSCQENKDVEAYDKCRYDIALQKKQFSQNLEKCFSSALKTFPDKLKNEPIEIEQSYIDNNGNQNKFSKMIGPFTQDELDEKRRSSRNDCMYKEGWNHPKEWIKGRISSTDINMDEHKDN